MDEELAELTFGPEFSLLSKLRTAEEALEEIYDIATRAWRAGEPYNCPASDKCGDVANRALEQIRKR